MWRVCYLYLGPVSITKGFFLSDKDLNLIGVIPLEDNEVPFEHLAYFLRDLDVLPNYFK
jgi:hypothetical protein